MLLSLKKVTAQMISGIVGGDGLDKTGFNWAALFDACLGVATKFGKLLTVRLYEAIAPIDFSSEPLANTALGDKYRQNAPYPDLIVPVQTGKRGQFSRILVSKPPCGN